MVAKASMRTPAAASRVMALATLQLLEVHQGPGPQKPLLDEDQERGPAAHRPYLVAGVEHPAGFGDSPGFEEIEVSHGVRT